MRVIRTMICAAMTAALAAALVACTPNASPPDAEPTLRGVIVAVTPGDEGGTIRVVWHESVGNRMELDAADLTVEPGTDIFSEGGSPIDFADLDERDVVQVWITGPVAESYPVQATADAVEVVGRFDDVRPLPIPPGLVDPQ